MQQEHNKDSDSSPVELGASPADLAALDRALARDQLEQLLATAEEALL